MIALLLLLGAAAPAADCPHDPSAPRGVPVRVIVAPVAAEIRRDVPRAGLAALASAGHPSPHALQGLTVVEHRQAERAAIQLSAPLLGGRACAWIEALTIDLTPESLRIYVPSEYAPGGCEDVEILRHEREHEEINRAALLEAAGELRRAFAAADWLPGRSTPLSVADRAEADRRVERMVERVAAPVYARFQEELARRQAVLDLPENYARVSRRCSGWR